MTMRDISVTILKPDGRPYPGVQVQVVDYSSGALASLYKEDGYTSANNPMITDSNGYASAMAPIGSYALVAISGSARRVVKRIVISDKVEQTLSTHTHVMNDITDAGALATKNQAGTTDIVDGAVTSAKLADLAVISSKLADAAVITAKIADAAVTEAKINASAVTSTKIADLAIITAKLADAAITTAKLADSSVTASKITTGAVTEAALADLSVSTAKLQDNAVTTIKIIDAAITTAKLADAALTAIGALTPVDGKLIKYTGATTAALITVTAFIETLLDDADAASARTTLGVIGAPSGLTENVIPKANANGDLVDSQFADNGTQVTLWGRYLRMIGTGPKSVEALNNASSDYVTLIRRGLSSDDVEIGIGGTNIVTHAPIKHASKWVEFVDHHRSVTFDPLTLSPPGSPDAPDQVALNGTSIQVAAFDSASVEAISDFFAIDGNFKEGSSIVPFVRWMPTDTGTGAVKWTLEYTIISAGETVSSSTTISFAHGASGTAWRRQDINLPTISETLNFGDQIHFRFYRDAGDVSDDYAADAVCLSFGFHILVNSIGSNAQTSKI